MKSAQDSGPVKPHEGGSLPPRFGPTGLHSPPQRGGTPPVTPPPPPFPALAAKNASLKPPKPIEECTVGIVGLGLMGGAIALALGKHCGVKAERLLACDPDEAALAEALEQGLIGGAYTRADQGFCPGPPPTEKPNMLGLCDLVFLCLNPSTLIRFLGQWMGAFKSGALITDIAGIKGNIARTVETSLREDLDFIPGHPMAGAEGGGFAKAGLCRFQGKNYILTPLKRNSRENLDYLKALIRRMGFGRITETSPEDHDGKIALTSQLCHVIAGALIDCEDDPGINRFGGGSFEDLTRIAMLNAPMWTELFMENRAALLDRLDRFEQSLGELKALIAGEDAPALETRLRIIRERRGAMNE